MWKNALELLKTRSELMAAAGGGAMTAVMGFDQKQLFEVVESTQGVVVANDNSTAAVTFAEAAYPSAANSGNLVAADFKLFITGGVATLSASTPSSISKSGNVYTLGIPLNGTPSGSEVLKVEPVENSIYDALDNISSTNANKSGSVAVVQR